MDRKAARRRALRAAQVVTLGLSMAAGGGCGTTHDIQADGGANDDALVADSGIDSGGEACVESPAVTEACCELEPGGYWSPEEERCYVAIPGPFVPPSMTA